MGGRASRRGMKLLRTPAVLIGLLLAMIGFGNVYTGSIKTAEYEELLATPASEPQPPRQDDAPKLEPHLRTTLLSSLAGQQDPNSAARAKLDFYRVVYSGGRLLTLAGLFCALAGAIHYWYRESRPTTALGSRG